MRMRTFLATVVAVMTLSVATARGALSYAIADYVFLCGDGAAVDLEPVCDCVEPSEGTP